MHPVPTLKKYNLNSILSFSDQWNIFSHKFCTVHKTDGKNNIIVFNIICRMVFQTFKFFEWDENDWERKTAWNQIFEFFFGQSKYWNNFWNFVLVPGDGALDPVDVVWDLGVHPWVVRPGTAQAPADNSDLSLQWRHSEIKGLASFLPPDC